MQYRPIRFPTGEVRATTAALANVSKEKPDPSCESAYPR